MNIFCKVAGLSVVIAAVSLSGCVSQRISGALERYGLDSQRSECVGDSLATHLSTAQLQSLGRAARVYKKGDTDPDALTMSDFIRVAGEIRDPKVPLEVARAAVQCDVLSADSIVIPPAQ